MLPRLPAEKHTTPEVTAFIRDVQASSFCGDIEIDAAALVVASTDNSIWQCMPQAIISPRTSTCVENIVTLLSQQHHRNISLTPRGGGTSTAGQALSHSVVLDCKRHMHHILEFDEETSQVLVECGAVLQKVNDELHEYGVMIGPTVATATRATIGGMIGNDSAGKGSQVYGKMSDCVVELSTVLRDGKTFRTNTHTTEEHALCTAVKQACDAARPHFSNHWPELPRFVSGYNLPMAWDGETFDLNRVFCGAEGTLGVTTSATLQCVPIPSNQQLLLLCFDSFDAALRCGSSLTKYKPTAIETVDELVIQTVRNDASWSSVSTLFGNVKDDANAILLVEFSGEFADNIKVALQHAQEKYNPLFAKCIQDKAVMELAWSFRSRSVGLLSSLQGEKRPIPFVEDCAVPPERLADFICDFKSILDSHQLRAGMFGHVDAGVIHVRPALDMRNQMERAKVQEITSRIVELVQSYGGVLWGEHGKGFRSEYGPQIFGTEIWKQICNIKTAFDPYNQFNPGKVAVPDGFSFSSGTRPRTRGERDEHLQPLGVLTNASHCDGNGECHSVSTHASMCPTYRATNDPIHSPRGRADVLRYWLSRIDKTPLGNRGSFIQRIFCSGNTDDVSHQVREALDGCLGCKACATDCPMQIDVPSMQSEFYNTYFGRYLRPLRDFIWLNMEQTLRFQTSLIGQCIPTRLIASALGITDVPKPSRLLHKHITTSSPKEINASDCTVVLLQDSFTSYFRSSVLLAMIQILEFLGEKVAILPLRPCGKALHVRGALHRFNRVAKENVAWLGQLKDENIRVIGVDPAATLLWRDEYPKALGFGKPSVQVLLPQEWLVKQDLSSIHLHDVQNTWRLFPHCIECSTAPSSSKQWELVFESIGSELEVIETACCGMGGLWGHQKEYKEQSIDIWNLHWQPYKPQTSNALTTGYSCHSQAKRVEHEVLLHPLEIIATSIRLQMQQRDANPAHL